jgi:hypothetical protein
LRAPVGFAALLCAVLASALLADPAPQATIGTGARVVLQLPASVLESAAIRSQLASGLTTAFVIRANAVDGSGHQLKGGGRIEIRFELWNERYIVDTLAISGKRERLIRDNWTQLIEWWSRHPLAVLQLRENAKPPRTITARLDVLPFSAREEDDARRFLAQSQNDAARGESGTPAARSILDLVVGTSLRRRPIASLRWTVPVKATP